MKRIVLVLLNVLISIIGNSQPFSYSGRVFGSNGQGLQNIPIELWAKRTSAYEITYPPYSIGGPYNGGQVVPSSDDAVHGPFNIGFTFRYFGQDYQQFYIGSNGWIGFSAGQTTGYTAQYIPNQGSPKNAILADWEDLFPGSANIWRNTIGVAPNRRLVVSFNNVPHYSCRTLLFTFQIVLYEGSNIIDINYLQKPICGSNLATAGLISTQFDRVVPIDGKNASLWQVSNYSVRFVPQSPEVNFSLKLTTLSNSLGNYTIQPGLDQSSYQFLLVVKDLPRVLPKISDFNECIGLVLQSIQKNSIYFYLYDINNDGKITISDAFYIMSMINGIRQNWNNVPNFRIFLPSEWNIIISGTTDLKPTLEGRQNLSITPQNGGSQNFYILTTGQKN